MTRGGIEKLRDESQKCNVNGTRKFWVMMRSIARMQRQKQLFLEGCVWSINGKLWDIWNVHIDQNLANLKKHVIVESLSTNNLKKLAKSMNKKSLW